MNRNDWCIATGEAELTSDGDWCGFVSNESIPIDLRTLLRDLEQMANDQLFSVVDEKDKLIAGQNLSIRLEDGRKMRAVRIFINSDWGISWKDNCEP